MQLVTSVGVIKFTGVEGVENPEQYAPVRKTPGAVGYDVHAVQVLDRITREVSGTFPRSIRPSETVLFGVGIIMAMPEGVGVLVTPRSGLATKQQLLMANGPGLIDWDYRGQIAIALRNFGDNEVEINLGDRIAQLIFFPTFLPVFHYVPSETDMPISLRGSGGFGSTGRGQSEGIGTANYDEAVLSHDIGMMRVAKVIGQRSNCIRGCQLDKKGMPVFDADGQLLGRTREIGCIITLGDSIVASGYNAQHPGARPCAEIGCIREQLNIPSGERLEICQAIHAEDMALNNALRAGLNIHGCSMYCTAEPCRSCARKIAGLGLEALVVIGGGYSSQEGLNIVQDSGTVTRVLDSGVVD